MDVHSVGSCGCLSMTNHLEREHQVQDVFAEILAEAGRQGYASARPVGDDEPLTEQISETWSSWFDGELGGGRYQGEEDAEELKQAYDEILVRAYDEGGYTDPKSFLQSLSSDELAVVQRIQRLAEPIQVDSLSEEGAVNLLVPPAAQVDLNHDGLTRCGVAYGIRFPYSNTPAAVAEAWEEATADMDFAERMIYEFHMMLPLLTANIVCDENGAFQHRYEPGDLEFTNPMASPNYSYVQATQDMLDYLDAFQARMPQNRNERDKAFWTDFQNLLNKHGAP